ncbi:MAG: Rare lipoprotein A [uncultured bacterium]|nr:MAG: Rare lipoprotein A [uncultured bacterium]
MVEDMMINKIKKTLYKILIISGIFFGSHVLFVDAKELDFGGAQKNIQLNDNGVVYETTTNSQTVSDFIKEHKIEIFEKDVVLPEKNEKIFSGTNIIILRAKKLSIKEGGDVKTIYTFRNTVEEAIWENRDIKFDEDDISKPVRNSNIKGGETIVITHVLIKEETKNLDIDFKTISNEDDSLGWRVKKVTKKGEKGQKEIKYKVVYNDGKEISRKILESNIVKEPVNEVVTQGTMVKVGKVHTGAASWYAWTGTLAAANPWLPMGSYVRVTNKANGKQVIVKINDRGPFGPGRIIDLDKVAFAQIASVGAGVIDVKMEVITN